MALCQHIEPKSRQLHFYGVEVQPSIYQLIPHEDTLKPLKKHSTYNYEANLIYSTTGNKAWHSVYHYPKVGISAKFVDFKYPDVLGYAIGIYPFIDFTVFSKDKFYSNFRVGLGMAYISEKYDAIKNPLNIAISSSINVIGTLRLNIGYHLTQNVILTTSIGLAHLSNGAFNKPNYGLNLGGAGIGILYIFNETKPSTSSPFDPISKSNNLSISFMGGIKEIDNGSNSKYYPLTFQVIYLKSTSRFFEYGGTLDLMHDKSSKFHIIQKNQHYSSPNDDICIGTTLHLQFPLDKFASFAEIGLYLYKPNPKYPQTYQRIGCRYKLNKTLTLLVALRTHLNIADHVDWGLTIAI